MISSQPRTLVAMALLLGVVFSAYSASQASILVKARGGALHPAARLFGQMLCGLPLIISYSLIVEGNPLNFHWTGQAVAAVFYLATFGTIIAFWMFYWLLGRMESTMPMMISVVTPLIAVLLGWMILDETLPPQTFFGGLLIMASIALTVFKRKAP